MEIAIILIVVLIGLVLGDLALVRAIGRRRNDPRHNDPRRNDPRR